MNLSDLPEEYQTLRVPSSDFDARAFLKKYLREFDYDYLNNYSQKSYEDRRNHQDEQLQQLVLDHLSVFVQCKDAIEDVYNSDKQLFTGAAMSEIVEIFSQFREQMIEPLLQPILTMDAETNHIRRIQNIATRNAAVLNLPFQALRSALSGDFDDCVQHMKSIVSFLDSSKFQRYSVMNGSNNNNNSSGSSTRRLNSEGGGGGSSTSGSSSSDTSTTSNPNNNNNNAGDSTNNNNNNSSQQQYDPLDQNNNNSSLFQIQTLQPFEVVHRLFASWISAAEDTAYFALFLARHELAGSFTLLQQHQQQQSLMMVSQGNNNNSNNNNIGVGVSLSAKQNQASTTMRARTKNQQQQHQQNAAGGNNNNNNNNDQQGATSRGLGGGVRLVELEDLLFQIIRLLDVVSMIRWERYQLLGPRAVEVADAARQANCTTTKNIAKTKTTTSASSVTTTTTTGDQNNNNKKSSQQLQQQQSKNNNNNSNQSQQQVQFTSREIGIAKYLSAVLSTGVKNSFSSKKTASSANFSNNNSAEKTPTDENSNNNNSILPTPGEILEQAKFFTQVFGDPKPQHPILVYCHLFERSIHLNVSSSITKLELEVRSVEVTAEQQDMYSNTNNKDGNINNNNKNFASNANNSGSLTWWSQFVPQAVSNIRLGSVAPDHFQMKLSSTSSNSINNAKNQGKDLENNENANKRSRIPNRISLLAKSLLMLREEGLTSNNTVASPTSTQQERDRDDKSNSKKSSTTISFLDSTKPLSLSAAVLKHFQEPDLSSPLFCNKNVTSDENNQDENSNNFGKYSTSSSWLDGKSDEDAIWFADHCEENLQIFRAILACLAPPSISNSLTAPSSSSSNNSNNNNQFGNTLSSSASGGGLENDNSNGSSNRRTTAASNSSNCTRHKSMNVISNNLTSLVRDALRGVASAWKRISPLLRVGSLFREDMEWLDRAGLETTPGGGGGKSKKKNSSSPASATAKRDASSFLGGGAGGDETLNVTFTGGKLLEDDDAANNGNDVNEPELEDFLSSAAMLRRLFSSTMMNSFNLSVPSRTIDKLHEICSGFKDGGSGDKSSMKKASTLLVASARLEMTNWLKTFGKFASALFREFLLSDIQGFFCSLAAMKFSTSASTSGNNNNKTSNSKDSEKKSFTATTTASASSSTTTTPPLSLENELAITIRRWSAIVNNLVRDITEMQRTISLECDLDKNQDPFYEAEIVQTSLLIPLTTSFAEGIRRIFCIARHEVWAPKSPGWVLKEMESDALIMACLAMSAGGGAQSNGTGNMGSSNNGNNSSPSAATSSSSSSSSVAGSSSFSEMLESFVAQTRHSLTNRFGASGVYSLSDDSSSTTTTMMSNRNTSCSEFTVSTVETTSKILTICAPLLRVVKRFDLILCNLIGGVVLDQIAILQRRASCAALLEKSVNTATLDVDCASWLTFLSCAPFSENADMKIEVLRAFGGMNNTAGGSSPSNSTMTMANSSKSSSNRPQETSPVDTGNKSAGFPSSTSTTKKQIRALHVAGGSGGETQHSSVASDFLSRTASKQLLGYVRCTILEQCVADATAIAQTAVPTLIADNIAATLTFRATTITDSRLTSASSSTTSWLNQFFLHREEGRTAAGIDGVLKQNRRKFMATNAVSCLLPSSLPSSSVVVSAVEKVYQTASSCIQRLASQATVAALDVWFALGVARTTYNIDRSIRYDEDFYYSTTASTKNKNSSASVKDILKNSCLLNNIDTISFSQYSTTSTKGVSSSSVDLFPFLVENLIYALRWRRRCDNYFTPFVVSTSSSSSSSISCWDSVVSPALQWLIHYEKVLLTVDWDVEQEKDKMENEGNDLHHFHSSPAISWQKTSFYRFVNQLHHLIESHFINDNNSSGTNGSNVLLSQQQQQLQTEKQQEWLKCLRTLLVSTTTSASDLISQQQLLQPEQPQQKQSTGSSSSAASMFSFGTTGQKTATSANIPHHNNTNSISSFTPSAATYTACCSYSALLDLLSSTLISNQKQQQILQQQQPRIAASSSSSATSNNSKSSNILPPETLDNFLTKDAPIEFISWQKDRGFSTAIASDKDSSLLQQNQPMMESWWAADSRGAERREVKLVERRGARMAAATNLLNQNAFHAPHASNEKDGEANNNKGEGGKTAKDGARTAGRSLFSRLQSGAQQRLADGNDTHLDLLRELNEEEDDDDQEDGGLGKKRKLLKRKKGHNKATTSFFSRKAEEANQNAESTMSAAMSLTNNLGAKPKSSLLADRLSALAGNPTVGLSGGIAAAAQVTQQQQQQQVTISNDHQDAGASPQPVVASSRLQGLLGGRQKQPQQQPPQQQQVIANVPENNNVEQGNEGAASAPGGGVKTNLFVRKKHNR